MNKKYVCNDCGVPCVLDAEDVGEQMPTTCPWSVRVCGYANWQTEETCSKPNQVN